MFDPWDLEPEYAGPPADYRLKTGRNAGRTLGEAFRLDPDYFGWLTSRGPDLQVRRLAQLVLDNPPPPPEPVHDPYIDGDWPEYVHKVVTKGIDM
jgi:hypothetical protein